MITISSVKLTDAFEIFEMASKLSMSFDVTGKHHFNDFEHVVTNEKSIFLIAHLNGLTTGYLYGNTHHAFYAAREIAWIEELFVLEEYRGKGIATALIKQAESIAIQRDALLISVATRRAELFYEKFGYERSAQYLKKLL